MRPKAKATAAKANGVGQGSSYVGARRDSVTRVGRTARWGQAARTEQKGAGGWRGCHGLRCFQFFVAPWRTARRRRTSIPLDTLPETPRARGTTTGQACQTLGPLATGGGGGCRDGGGGGLDYLGPLSSLGPFMFFFFIASLVFSPPPGGPRPFALLGTNQA